MVTHRAITVSALLGSRDAGRVGDRASYEPGLFASVDPLNIDVTQDEVDSDPDENLTEVECRIPGQAGPGPCVPGDPINNVLPVGSNGFPGYSSDFTAAFDRGSKAGYLDLEADVSGRLLVGAAGRLEDSPGSASFADPDKIQRLSGKILVDLRAAWRPSDTFSVTLGGQNVLGQTPDRAQFEACCGRIYRSDSMITRQGAYYYVTLGADF